MSQQAPTTADGEKSMRGFYRHFLGEHPRDSLVAFALLVLASAAEGVSIAALFPMLQGFAGTGAIESTAIGRTMGSVLRSVGLPVTVYSLLWTVVAGIVAKGIMSWLAMRRVGFAVATVTTRLRMRLMHALLHARWGYFTEQSRGAMANAVSAEATQAGLAFHHGVAAAARAVQVVVYAAVILVVSWAAFLFAIAAGLALVGPLGLLVRRAHKMGVRQADFTRSFVSILLGAVHGMKPIRAMGREEPFEELLTEHADELREAIGRRISATEGLTAAQEPMLALVVGIGFTLVTQFVTVDFALLVVLGFLFWRVAVQLNRAQQHYNLMASYVPYFWGIHSLSNLCEAEAETHTGEVAPPEGPAEITFDDVGFAYGDAWILQNVSLHVPAGSFVVLIGPSGAGKTTLMDMLAGLRSPTAGHIRVGDAPLDDIDLAAWRARVGYVPQEMTLITGTLRENVALGARSVSDEAIHTALNEAGASSFVDALPGGLDTSLGEHGAKLSGGQRQRVALARALVGAPSLLMLDEVSAALDPESEKEVVTTLGTLAGRRTIVAITHQRAMVEVADIVLALGDGRAMVVDRDEALRRFAHSSGPD